MSVGLIVCRSTDSGAPVLSGTNGALVAVLDWALAQKGWTISATATNQRIYKQAAGNGYCLYVAHDSTVSGSAQYATMRGCEAASTIASLVNPFPSLAQVANTVQRAACSAAVSTAARPYVIYVTDRYVRMHVDINSNNSQWFSWHFGDMVATTPGDAYATFMSAGNGTYLSGVFLIEAASVGYFARDITGTIISSYNQMNIRGAATMGSTTRGVNARAGYMNRILREKVSYDCYGSTSATIGPTSIPSRAWAPNLWTPVHNNIGSVSFSDTFADSAYNPSASFRAMGYSATVWSIVEESDTWSAPSG